MSTCHPHPHPYILILITHSDPLCIEDADGNGCGAAHWAAYKGENRFLKYLEYFGHDFFALDHEQMSVLHRATLGGSLSTCEYLVKKGLNPYLKNGDGSD